MTDPNLAVVVLAAGEGTRMKSATPKVLHAVAGIPMIGHVLATARALEPAHVVTVVRHARDQVVAAIAEFDAEVLIADQDDIPGTGRAVEIALEALPGDFDGDVVVVSGDVPLLDADTLRSLVDEHRRARCAATVLSAILDDATGYGRIVRSGDGSLDRIVEQKDAAEHELEIREINSGSYAFSARGLREHLPRIGTENAQGEKYLTDVIGLLKQSGAMVTATPVREAWLVEGVNDRVQLAAVSKRLNRMIVEGWMRAGVTVQDPETTWIDRDVTLEPDVEILRNTQLARATTIASGAVIGPDTTLTSCEVGAGARVLRTEASHSVIGAGATVGPFAYLRPGTQLGADGKIGTFVETKNAVLGTGTKVPHLSYIGDAEVGEGTNIGAGTIVANYDGVAKHRTSVGSHARTGSHNVFVAPVRIGDGAYTGAGTVVRKDVPPGSLAMSVAPQRNIEGWVGTNRPGTAAADAAEAANADPS